MKKIFAVGSCNYLDLFTSFVNMQELRSLSGIGNLQADIIYCYLYHGDKDLQELSSQCQIHNVELLIAPSVVLFREFTQLRSMP